MSLAITYHSVFNMLVQSEFYYYYGALLPIVTFIPFAIARLKLVKEVKKNETV
jgi:hypothetical protein